MGHYDSCYEHDAEDKEKERQKKINSEFKELTKKLKSEDKEFLITIIKNIEDYKALNRLIINKLK